MVIGIGPYDSSFVCDQIIPSDIFFQVQLDLCRCLELYETWIFFLQTLRLNSGLLAAFLTGRVVIQPCPLKKPLFCCFTNQSKNLFKPVKR